MPAGLGRRSISFWHVHFQSSSMQTALLSGRVGRCGLKTNAKIGSTFSPQAGNFQAQNTETDTGDAGCAATSSLGCTVMTRVHLAGERPKYRQQSCAFPSLPAAGWIFVEIPPSGGMRMSWAEMCISKENPGWKKVGLAC